MALPISDPSVYADFAGLDQLKRAARTNDPKALRAVAQQFESLFTRMMIKSMRDAVGKDPVFGSDQEQMYQGMFDDQLSVDLARGRGLGLADMLIRQLQRMGVSGSGSATGAAADSTANSASAVSSGTGAAASPAPVSGSPSAAAHGAPSSATRAGFIRSLWPHAQKAARELGVAATSLIAQAALETNWGRSVPRDASGRSSHNLFGIKAGADWSGPSVASGTREYAGGAPQETTAQFRSYADPAQSFEDYVALLRSNPRYAAALNTGGDAQAFAAALQRGGYATDPDYARKVSAVARSLAALQPAASSQAEPLKLADALPIDVNTRTL